MPDIPVRSALSSAGEPALEQTGELVVEQRPAVTSTGCVRQAR
jgi:hypothetical protein